MLAARVPDDELKALERHAEERGSEGEVAHAFPRQDEHVVRLHPEDLTTLLELSVSSRKTAQRGRWLRVLPHGSMGLRGPSVETQRATCANVPHIPLTVARTAGFGCIRGFL